MELNYQDFSGNKYFKWYNNICERAKERELPEEIYNEKHHIFPKSIYGQNKYFIKLTAKEHYIVHLVLWWGYRTKYGTKDKRTISMARGFSAMNMKNDNTKQRYNSKEYSFLRIAWNETIKGENHPKYGKKDSEKTKKLKSEKLKNLIPWNKGKTNVYTKERLDSQSKKKKDKKVSQETKKLQSEKAKKRFGDKTKHPMYNHVYSQETLKLQSEKAKGRTPWNKGKTDVYSQDALNNMRKPKSNSKNMRKPKSENHIKNMCRKVYKYDLNMNFIEEYS